MNTKVALKKQNITVGKNVFISKSSIIGKNSIIGNNVTVYKNVNIGKKVTIFDGAVLGRPPKATKSIVRKPNNKLQPLFIGNGCVIGANCVLYTGTHIGNNVLIGDLTSIREECSILSDVVIGRGVLIMYNTKIGYGTKIIDGAIITGNMIIENNVFIGPGVITINDNSPYLKRYGLEKLYIQGPIIRKYALVGAGANINASVEIGEGSIVAPNSIVTKNVPPWTIVMGIPAKIRNVIPQKQKIVLLKYFDLTSN